MTEVDSAVAGLPGHHHAVQFYERDEHLYALVGDFLAQGARAGEPLLVLASSEHRDGFVSALRARGVQDDSVTFLDARQTLEAFMSGPTPDSERFFAQVGGLIDSCGAGKGQVRAYGEMVDLLWRDGNPEGAVKLEELWNELRNRQPFALLCAYAMGNFFKGSDSQVFDAICDTHTDVLPADSAIDGHDDPSRLIARLQQRAVALQTEIQHRMELESALRESLAARQQAENELRRLYEVAQEASRAKDQFLATVSHELRTPLTAILGWSRMLTLGLLDAETARTAVDTIERSARAQASIIDDLLDVAKIVTGKMSLQTELVALNAVIDDAVQTCRLAAEAKSIEITFDRDDRGPVVTGDPTRLRQIVWNLLTNAVKYSPAGSRVALKVRRTHDEAVISVSDSGRGIDPSFAGHLFEPFRQADAASTRGQGGLGLGLAIVKHLTELHGGTVSVESGGRGHGSVFTVRLPLVRRVPRSSEAVTADIVLHGRRLLVIDDDAATCEMLSTILRRFGGEVEIVSSLPLAMHHLSAGNVDAVVTDIAMPGHDGFELLAHLRAAHGGRRSRVVALTAISEPGTEERLLQAGFDAYLRKPVDPLSFARVIADLVRTTDH